MSFSAEVKENLSKISNFNKEILLAEFLGYALSGNFILNGNVYQFITENEFNIEHFYKILFNLQIEYEPEINGKCYIAQIDKKIVEEILMQIDNIKGDNKRNIIKGAFLGSGSINNPEKNYHLEISFNDEKNRDIIKNIAKEYGIIFKEIRVNEKFQLYIKESDEISKLLALIGANKAVLKFEDVRILKEMKNKVNRKVNCETANLNKTIDAAIRQIDDINFLIKRNKFEDLPQEIKEIANLRLENPELSLKDLSELTNEQISKSKVNRILKKIHDISQELR